MFDNFADWIAGNVDVMVISETKLDDSFSEIQFKIPGFFSSFCLDCTAQKMKFSIMDFFSKCEQICSFLRIGMENFIFCLNRNQNGRRTMVFVREDIPGKFLFFENKLIETKCILN